MVQSRKKVRIKLGCNLKKGLFSACVNEADSVCLHIEVWYSIRWILFPFYLWFHDELNPNSCFSTFIQFKIAEKPFCVCYLLINIENIMICRHKSSITINVKNSMLIISFHFRTFFGKWKYMLIFSDSCWCFQSCQW